MTGPEELPERDEELALDATALATLAVHARIAAALDGPAFGTAEWLELDEHDPRRMAAMFRAAFCWWAAEHEIGAPASREKLDALVAEQVSAELVAASHAVADAKAAQEVVAYQRWLARERAADEEGRQEFDRALRAWDRFLARERRARNEAA